MCLYGFLKIFKEYSDYTLLSSTAMEVTSEYG